MQTEKTLVMYVIQLQSLPHKLQSLPRKLQKKICTLRSFEHTKFRNELRSTKPIPNINIYKICI